MNEFLNALLQAVVIAVVPVLAAFAGKGLKALAAYLGEKSQNETARKYLDEAAQAVAAAVTFISQRYVDAWKKAGEFDQEKQTWALKEAIGQAKLLLTERAKDFLVEAYGSLDLYLEGMIEAEVRNQKVSVSTHKLL